MGVNANLHANSQFTIYHVPPNFHLTLQFELEIEVVIFALFDAHQIQTSSASYGVRLTQLRARNIESKLLSLLVSTTSLETSSASTTFPTRSSELPLWIRVEPRER